MRNRKQKSSVTISGSKKSLPKRRYQENVKKLGCFLGIRTHTALSLIVETGDFKRFAKGNTYAAFLGLAPGEHSSSENVNRLGISKAGNTHLRCLLIEAAKGICKGAIGHKSQELRSRQSGQTAEVIAYADKANTRLRSKYYKMIRHEQEEKYSGSSSSKRTRVFCLGDDDREHQHPSHHGRYIQCRLSVKGNTRRFAALDSHPSRM